MKRTVGIAQRVSDVGTNALAIAIFALLVVYWISTVVFATVPLIGAVRAVAGILLLIVVPGALVTLLLGAPTRINGRFLVQSVAASVAIVTILAVSASVVFPYLGVARPLTSVWFGALLSVTITVLAVAVISLDERVSFTVPDGPFSVLLVLTLLPTVAAVAAIVMNQFRTASGMFLFFAVLAAVALWTTRSSFPRALYPAAVFSIAISTLFHRNLLTSFVVGADVQGLVAIAERIGRAGVWTPEVADITLPVVTAFPVVASAVVGFDVHTTFKLVHVLIYAFVPLGVYYLGRDVFDPEVGLYGALLLTFYHVTFLLTPGKQLLSQLFVVAMLLAVRSRPLGSRAAVAVGLSIVGLVFSHYTTAYTLGCALLAASLVVTTARRWTGVDEPPLPLRYPIALLVGATVWYGVTAPTTLALIGSLPAVAAGQIAGLLVGRAPVGTGASYVTAQQGWLELFNVFLYLIVTGLLVVGVGAQSLTTVEQLRRRTTGIELGYTALALPLLALLASSYVLSLNFWADRVYQLVLVVLAPFVPRGYRALLDTANRAVERLGADLDREETASDGGIRDRLRPSWTPVAALLVALLLVNSGVVFALAGTATTSTFNPDANDRVFDGQERAGALWIGVHANITDVAPGESLEASRVAIDDPSEVQVFTDSVSAQLFRSTLPAQYTTVDVVLFKSEWRPEFDRESIQDGYVYLRQPAVKAGVSTGELPPSSISRQNARSITDRENLVYSNGVVEIVQTGNATG